MSDLKAPQKLQNTSVTGPVGYSSVTKLTVMRRVATMVLILAASMSYLVLSRGCDFLGMARTNVGHLENVKALSSLGPVGTVKWYECEEEGSLPGAECGHIMCVYLAFVRIISHVQAHTESPLTIWMRAQELPKSLSAGTTRRVLREKESSC